MWSKRRMFCFTFFLLMLNKYINQKQCIHSRMHLSLCGNDKLSLQQHMIVSISFKAMLLKTTPSQHIHYSSIHMSHLFFTRNIKADDFMSPCGTWSINWIFIFNGAAFALPLSSPTWKLNPQSFFLLVILSVSKLHFPGTKRPKVSLSLVFQPHNSLNSQFSCFIPFQCISYTTAHSGD